LLPPVAALVLAGLLADRLPAQPARTSRTAQTAETAERDWTPDDRRLYTELVHLAHDRYGAEVSYEDLVFSSLEGVLRALDPHTSFLSPEAYSGMRQLQQTSFYGVGILVGIRSSQLTVISPIEDGPASRMGIQAGDVISTIEGEPTEAMTLDEAVQKLKGPKGTQVEITIVRRGLSDPLAMAVTRAEISQATVRQTYMLTPDTGYVQLTAFSHGTGREMADAIAKLEAKGMKQLLLDLRNNGGGLLDQAIEVADRFLPADSTIVETRGRIRDSFQSYRASGEQPDLRVPVVVLVNEGTASAAEILVGAIQDHDRGLVVGQPTWGKGLVQTVYNLSYGAGLALTTARYYTPSGRMIQRDYGSYYDYYMHEGAGSPEVAGNAAEPSEIFATDLGRKVYGGGAITPDVLVKAGELPPFASFLLARNAYVSFAVDYTRRHRQRIQSADWRPGPELEQELRDWVVAEKIATAEEAAKASDELRAISLIQARAEILNLVFGQEARHRALAEDDEQLQAALRLFERAATMLAQRQAMGNPRPR
jgi:carboxyl-terminal processing protease